MSVIIRLQNLPWTANALDIRHFFGGLQIPDGGVHIVGGDKGDAFVAFGTDDDARKAMMLDGGMVNESPVKLFLSSKSEMQNVIAVARGGIPSQAEDPSSFGRQSVPVQGAGSQMGPTSLMSQQPSFGGGMSGDFSQSRQSQPNFSASGAGASGGQFGRDNQNLMGSFGDNRQQGGMGSFGTPTQPLGGGSTNQGFQSGQNTWDRPMQSNISSSPASGEFGSLGMQQNQMSSFGGRDSSFGGRDRGRDSGFGSMNTFSGSNDLTRQSSSFGSPNLSNQMGGSAMPSPMGGSTLTSFNRDNQTNLGGGMGGNISGNLGVPLGGSLGSNMGSSYGNRDAPKREPFMDRPREETNIFLQPRDQVRPQTGNIFLQGRDQNRGTSSLLSSTGNFNSPGGNFNSPRSSGMGGSTIGGGSGMGGGNRMGGNTNMGGGNRMGGNTGMGGGSGMGGGHMFQDSSNRNNRNFSENQGNFQMQDRNQQRGGFQENRGGGGRGFQDNRSMGVDNQRNDRGRPSIDMKEPEVTVIMTNLPTKTNYRDLRRFFGTNSEVVRDGVKLINDKFGQRSGKAYVKFAAEPDARSALRRNGDMIDGLRVNIVRCSAAEYDKAVDSYKPPAGIDMRRSPMKREVPRDSPRRPPSPKRERAPSPKARMPSPKLKPRVENKPRVTPKPRENQKPVMKEQPKSKTPSVKKEPSPKPKGNLKKEALHATKRDHSPKPKAQSPMKRTRSRSGTPPRKRQASDSGENCCMLLKNLPFKASKADVKKFFNRLRIAHRGGPYLETRDDGKHTGTAFVQFETPQEAEESMSNDGKPLMGRSVEMVPISKREFEENVKSLRSNTPEPTEKVKEKAKPKDNNQNGNSKADDFKFYCIKMKGLPYSATNQTVREFFQGLEVASRGVHLVYNSQKQAAGTAFVEFVTTRDCKKAQAKHKENMGKRYILIEAMSKKDMLDQLQEEQKRQRDNQAGAPPSLLDAMALAGNLGNNGNMGGMGSNMGGMGNNMGGMGNNMGGMGNAMGGISMMMGQINKEVGFMGGNQGGGKDNRGGGRLVPVMVQLQNLPFKVQMDEVLNFFRGYGPVRSSFKLDERDGRPTGKAVIGFHTQEQQQRALNELNRKQLLGRPIHIHPMDRF